MASKRKYLLALLSGFLLILTFPGTFGLGFCAWFALVPLLLAASEVKPGRAAIFGLICGITHYTFLIYWVVIAMCRYGGLSLWVSGLALLLLALYMSLYFVIFAVGISWAKDHIPLLWFAPIFWVALDLLRSKLFTGFPWQDLAYSQYNYLQLIQISDLFGHHGVTYLIVLANTFLFTLVAAYRKNRSFKKLCSARSIMAVFMIVFFAFAYSIIRFNQVSGITKDAETLAVAVVQGNIPQDQKWVRSFQKKTVNTYIDLSKKAMAEKKVDLLVWPETAMPYYPLESRFLPYLVDNLIRTKQVNLLTGAPHREKAEQAEKSRLFNSSFLVEPPGYIIGRYDKQHLVPFGEYVPLRKFLPFLEPIVEAVGDFTPGKSQSPLIVNNAGIGVLICFESIFPELARLHTVQGANLLVNITNDAWYGRSSAPWQHLSMAVFRAVENKKSLARAANTGVSALIDPAGRLLTTSPLFEPYYLASDLPLLKGPTFFSAYGYHFATACLIAMVPFFLIVWRKKK